MLVRVLCARVANTVQRPMNRPHVKTVWLDITVAPLILEQVQHAMVPVQREPIAQLGQSIPQSAALVSMGKRCRTRLVLGTPRQRKRVWSALPDTTAINKEWSLLIKRSVGRAIVVMISRAHSFAPEHACLDTTAPKVRVLRVLDALAVMGSLVVHQWEQMRTAQKAQ